ncbi:MAG: hypothetical protein JXQ75_08065 [Phycisphaerae bacterium]|nr:hypothetical protein [Phycisphaerae bacterium]
MTECTVDLSASIIRSMPIVCCLAAGSTFAQQAAVSLQAGYAEEIMRASRGFPTLRFAALRETPSRWLGHEKHTRQRHLLHAPWSFLQVKDDSVREKVEVTLPHRFSPREGVAGWYVQNLEMDAPEDGQRYFLCFEQVKMLCVVFVNGQERTRHLGGYTPFDVDITAALSTGINTIALYVHNTSISYDPVKRTVVNQVGVNATPNAESMRSGGWLSGGILQEVYLERRPETFVRETAIRTSVEKNELRITLAIENSSAKTYTGIAQCEVFSWPDGSKLVEAQPFPLSLSPGETKSESKNTHWHNPPLWSPDHPNLCVLRVTLPGTHPDVYEERFGFREFLIQGKQFFLNGSPIKLRGPSQLVPGTFYRGREETFEFCKKVFLCEKKILDINACRMHAIIGPRVVFEAADECGMLMINQSAIWSSMKRYYENGGDEFMENTRAEFAEWVKRDRNSPSVVVWDVENEMVRMGGELAFWNRLDGFVREHDATRIITHSGSGDRVDDRFSVNHAHMSESYTQQLKKWKESSNVPFVAGEYWLGSPGEHRLTSSAEVSTTEQYLLEYARLFNEKTLEMRFYDIPGVMPFAMQREKLYYQNSITDLAQPGAVCDACVDHGKRTALMRHGLASVVAFFWPRTESVQRSGNYEGTVIVCNDSETRQHLELVLTHDGKNVTPPEWQGPFRLDPAQRRTCAVTLPGAMRKSEVRAVLLSGGVTISQDAIHVRGIPLPAAPALTKEVHFFGSDDEAGVISGLGIPIVRNEVLPPPAGSIIIVGSAAREHPALDAASVNSFLEEGGMMLALHQERLPAWSPMQLGIWSSSRGAYAVYAPVYAPGHRVFSGLDEDDLRWWDGSCGRVSETSFVRPAAVGKTSIGAWRALAGASRFENVSLAEVRQGKGTVILAQLHLLENIDLAEPRFVFFNILSYLDEGGWRNSTSIKLSPSISKGFLVDTLGVDDKAFGDPDPENGDLLMVGDGATVEEVMHWASPGGRVVVFSREVASGFPGCTLSSDDRYRIGVRESDHPLLWGISSINFSERELPLVTASFSGWPQDARVLLQSLKADNQARSAQIALSVLGTLMPPVVNGGPVCIQKRVGRGEILLFPFAIDERSPFCREMVSTMLANAGAEIKTRERWKLEALARKTHPPVIDGKLDDWTEDMEDRNVTPYIHAEAVALSSANAVGRRPEDDTVFSGIVYFLWDNRNLYLAGVAFGEQANRQVSVNIGHRRVSLGLHGQPAVSIDGETKHGVALALGRIGNLSMLTDAALLSFTRINRRFGMLERVYSVPNVTFETAVPWTLLQLSPESEGLDLSIMLSSDEYTLVLPAEGNTGRLVIAKNLGKNK